MTMMVASANMRREFDQYADAYTDLLNDPIRKQFARDPLHFHRRKWLLLQDVLKTADVDISAQRWLDVGCGQGELLQMAGPHFAQATGCDPSAAMISRSNSFQVAHQPSLLRLPFDHASFDLVTAACVYHHVHGPARSVLIREIQRVLTPGGLCCILEHNPRNPVTRAIVRRCPVDVDAELLFASETCGLLQNAGFRTVSTDYFLYFPERIFERIGRVERTLRKVPFGGQYAVLARAPNSTA